VDATVRCSSGTYIRALARDLGAALETGGHLTALRRTAVGPYTLSRAHPLQALESQPEAESVIPLAEAAAAAFPRVDLTEDEAKRLAQGARLSVPPGLPQGTSAAAFAPDGTFVALVTAENYRLRSLAVFVDA
jgi:tRNA pseudouridine55 synthase